MKTLGSAADRRSIAERVSALKPTDRRQWGRMSVDQMVCHLCDAYRIPLGEKTVRPVGNLFTRTVLKFVAFRVPMKWPHGVQTLPEIEQGVGGTMPAEFEKDRAELLSLIDRFCSTTISPSIRHAIFGRMSAWEWLRWGYLHPDHHLRQFGR